MRPISGEAKVITNIHGINLHCWTSKHYRAQGDKHYIIFLKCPWKQLGPIYLLNIIYSIGSSCIANRVKQILPTLIDDDQTRFISNRYRGDSVRLVYDLIYYLNHKKIPGLLLCLDFENGYIGRRNQTDRLSRTQTVHLKKYIKPCIVRCTQRHEN